VNNELSTELLNRSQKDQDMRNKAIEQGMSYWDSSVDEQNTAYLEALVETSGWPTISAVGPEASQAAWLLVQHADRRPDFQARCLELMKALPEGDVSPRNIAYLEDRVRVAKGAPQLYGTQFYKEGDQFRPRPIEDEATLEERRAAMGLETFEANKQRIIESYGHLS
jgi:hypothetical protein